MKIDDGFSPSSDLRSQLVGRTPETRVDGRPQQARKTDNASDSASLSALSVEISRAIEKESPEVVTKIARLQEAVTNGTYSVPSSQISSRIVSSLIGA